MAAGLVGAEVKGKQGRWQCNGSGGRKTMTTDRLERARDYCRFYFGPWFWGVSEISVRRFVLVENG